MRSCPTCFVPYAEQVEFCGLDGTKLVFGATDLLIGKSLERYRILDVVGDGGMARVYRARHETLDREYALKVLYGEVASNKTLAERFRREAKTMSKISHENVVSVVDYGISSTGLTFLSMELIAGETLRTAIKRLGCMAPVRAAEIARQIAAGLSAAHRLGFVHRDLKPSNVMLVAQPQGDLVKLLDFGLVRATEIDGEVGFLTKTGQFVGTPIYMAPEQIIGGDVDPKADLYALGVVLYEMLEGKPPFSAKKLSEIRKKHLEDAPPRARAARGLELLVVDLLAKSPEARPDGTSEVIRRIDAIDFQGLGAAEIHISTSRELPPFIPEALLNTHAEARLASSIGSVDEADLSLVLTKRARWPWLLYACAAALLGIGAAYLLRADATDPDPDPTPTAQLLAPLPLAPPQALAPPPSPSAMAVAVVPLPPPRPISIAKAIKPKRTARSDRAIRKAAALRGMTLEDLAQHPELKRPYAGWSHAKQDEAAQAALLEAIAATELDPSFLQAKLDTINASLAEASATVPLTALRDFEDRYLGLAQANRPDLSKTESERLLRQAQKLLRDINAATRLPPR